MEVAENDNRLVRKSWPLSVLLNFSSFCVFPFFLLSTSFSYALSHLSNVYLKHVYVFVFINQSCIFFLKNSK